MLLVGANGCGSAADWNEAVTSNSMSVGGVDVHARQPSHVAVPVVYNRRMLYLHAVCLACLGALGTDDPPRGPPRSVADRCGNNVSLQSRRGSADIIYFIVSFESTAIGLIYLRSLGVSTIMFRYYLLGGNTAAPNGLYARLCHAFLVLSHLTLSHRI